jgi:hypothetical protein
MLSNVTKYKAMKMRLFFLPMLVGWLSLTILSAQESPPLSPFTVGVEMAFPVYIDCGNCQEESTTLTQAGLQTGFRLFRWLEIAAHANYYQVGSPAFSWATEALNQDLDFVYFDQQIRGVNVTIGPRLLLRVWQGDLSLEARYGFLWNRVSWNGTSISEEPYQASINVNRLGARAVRAAYTYWPKKRFGVRLGAEIASNQFFDRQDFPPFFVPVMGEQTVLVDAPREMTNFSFVVGTIYRF